MRAVITKYGDRLMLRVYLHDDERKEFELDLGEQQYQPFGNIFSSIKVVEGEDKTKMIQIDKIRTFVEDEIKIGITKSKHQEHNYPDCHCNDCLDAIVEYAGFQKEAIYRFRGELAKIISFCPLPNCCNIFIQGIEEPAFCEWLTTEEANQKLKKTKRNVSAEGLVDG